MTCFLFLLCIAGTFHAGAPGPAHAQPVGEPIDLVRELYRDMSVYPVGDRTYRLRYEARTVMSDTVRWKNTTSRVDVVMSERAMRMITPDMEVVRDSSTTVTVIPERRMIQISGVGMSGVNRERWKQVAPLNDSLLARLRTDTCIRSGAGPEELLVVRTTADSTLRRMMQIDRITFTASPTKRALKAIRLEFIPDSQIAEMDLTFETIDLNHPSDALTASAVSYIYDARGNLLPNYAGYQVSDLRTVAASDEGGSR